MSTCWSMQRFACALQCCLTFNTSCISSSGAKRTPPLPVPRRAERTARQAHPRAGNHYLLLQPCKRSLHRHLPARSTFVDGAAEMIYNLFFLSCDDNCRPGRMSCQFPIARAYRSPKHPTLTNRFLMTVPCNLDSTCSCRKDMSTDLGQPLSPNPGFPLNTVMRSVPVPPQSSLRHARAK
jgi:hypothetical protein